MALPSLRLEAPGLGELDFDPRDGWIVQSFDPGYPLPRESVDDAPDADGVIDSTFLSGPRVCTLSLVMSPFDGDIEAMEQRLKAYLNPRLRPSLFWQRNGFAEERQATVRAMSYAGPVEVEGETAAVVQWLIPSGIFESATEVVFQAAASVGSTDGLDWPVEWPIVWGTPNVTGLVEVTNFGDRIAWPIMQLHGAWSGRTMVQNLTTGQSLVFDNESVADGDYLEVDTRPSRRTVLLNGDPANSRYDRLVFPDSEWWGLVPGLNVLRFLPDTSAPPARMAGRFRHAFS